MYDIYSTLRYDESDEHERDAAWDDVNMTFPDAEYIEEF